MGDFYLARALHVLGVVLWIGGVAFVTLVLLPALRRSVAADERVAMFDRIEGAFATQARRQTLRSQPQPALQSESTWQVE